MQNRIDLLFQKKNKNVLSVFVTAGYPKKSDTLSIIQLLENSGADLAEIGIPFSDPIADGPVIQESSRAAISGGTDLTSIFEELRELRPVVKIPVLLMGYLNSVMQFGAEKFYKACSESGVDGLILPDLSLDEYNSNHKPLADKYNIHVVFLITPETSAERIRLIDEHSRGFIYLVSSSSTTGSQKGLSELPDEKAVKIRSMQLKNPILIGFGIKGPHEFSKACKLANGAIIGSSFISMLKNSANFEKDIRAFVQNIKNALTQFQL
jgi:tryptophan synthase alpha chain